MLKNFVSFILFILAIPVAIILWILMEFGSAIRFWIQELNDDDLSDAFKV